MGKKKIVKDELKDVEVVAKVDEPVLVTLNMNEPEFKDVEFISDKDQSVKVLFKFKPYLPTYAIEGIIEYCLEEYNFQIEQGANDAIATHRVMISFDMMVAGLTTNIAIDGNNYDALKYHGLFEYLGEQVREYGYAEYCIREHIRAKNNPVEKLGEALKDLIGNLNIDINKEAVAEILQRINKPKKAK